MKKKAPLAEGEMWYVYHVEEPLLGYGVTTYRAYSLFDITTEGETRWADEIEFYSSELLAQSDRFVIWSSSQFTDTPDSAVFGEALQVGLTQFIKLSIIGCSRWQQGWRYWPTS